MTYKPQWKNSREVLERIVIFGKLELDTPAHFGTGAENRLAAITLQRDALDGIQPLLPGTSIAGALRSELRQREKGYGWAESSKTMEKSLAEELFGGLDETARNSRNEIAEASIKSWLMVNDALGCAPQNGDDTELRDGVSIDAATRTVKEDKRGGHKFDIELLSAGTSFDLCFEFWRTKENAHLLSALTSALSGFEEGRINMGKRKNRGFGKCHVSEWQVWRFSMQDPADIIKWLEFDEKTGAASGTNIAALLNENLIPDARLAFEMQAQFKLKSSLLIRSEGEENASPDMVHLHSWRAGEPQPVLSGTSLAGVMRGRALRIANTCLGRDRGLQLVDEMFGRPVRDPDDMPVASKVKVEETIVGDSLDGKSGKPGNANLVQQRNKIDRFSGGTYPQALFSQQAVWGKADLVLKCRLNKGFLEEDSLFNAKVGLLLHVLKDLWTGDLAVGGESGVGRGRLSGHKAILDFADKHWELIKEENGQISFSGEDETEQDLEKFAAAFNQLAGQAEVSRG